MKPLAAKAVRQGDPREQGCVWKIWRSVWSSMTASLLLYKPHFHISNQTAKFKIGCTTSPAKHSHIYNFISTKWLFLFFSSTDNYLPNRRLVEDYNHGLNSTEDVAFCQEAHEELSSFKTCQHLNNYKFTFVRLL